ncbi:MAG: hypothetical protein EP330_18470 [Deltaproteobacteria bacterium]|nr:MAG: hypothetical protein EP330_18470 [Deltaproteobacteria bacterium]
MPEDPAQRLDAEDTLARLQGAGVIDEYTRPRHGSGLPRAERLTIDVAEGPVLYGNQQGGVRVRCPNTGVPAAMALSDALTRLRAGGAGDVACPCGESHDPNELDFAPPAAVATSALVAVDVDAYLLDEPARGLLAEILGPFRLIPRRVS